MISGIYCESPNNNRTATRFQQRAEQLGSELLFSDDRLLITSQRLPILSGEATPQMGEKDELVIVLSGSPFYGGGSTRQRDSEPGWQEIAELYRIHKNELPRHLKGSFGLVIYDRRQQSLFLARDHFGIEPLYYCEEDGLLFFASSIQGVVQLRGQGSDLHLPALGQILLFNYNISTRTVIEGIRRIPAAQKLIAETDKSAELSRYWNISFQPDDRGEEKTASELLEKLRSSVKNCLQGRKDAGVFLSGGMDSSTMLALSSEQEGLDLSTFSYRCRAASFDESHYARIMSKFVKSSHHECDYSSDEVLLMPEVVEAMNEPFCDVGINIATFLLGREAHRAGSRLILTGDGGDELFAGHPVYEADKMGRFADTLPRPLLFPFLSLFSLLPDSDQKKNLTVKLKRFAESLAFPKEMLSHRWRIYYNNKDLAKILGPAFGDGLNWEQLLNELLAINAEHSGPDMLSNCLHSDYQTVVDFYLRRNDLIRRFGVEVRYPMFDPELVEFCAAMPSKLKIKGWFDTKYIFKKAMEPVLPHDIIYRKDKLGHSIPLKNWIRDDSRIREMILDHLTGETVIDRGLFNKEEVNRMVNEHMAMKRNNSHRLWTLAVIEMWLRKHS